MRYRVIVEELTPAEDGVGDDAKTVIEFAGPGEMLARFAPGAVAEVLGAERAAVTVVMPEDRQEAPEPDPQTAATAAYHAERHEQVDKPTKRKRRTKAEIAADEAAQAAGFRDAAHQAEATVSGPGATPVTAEAPGQSDQHIASAAGADPGPEAEAVLAERAAGAPGHMTPAGPVVTGAPSDPLHTAEDQAAPPPPAGPAEPWNPFK